MQRTVSGELQVLTVGCHPLGWGLVSPQEDVHQALRYKLKHLGSIEHPPVTILLLLFFPPLAVLASSLTGP